MQNSIDRSDVEEDAVVDTDVEAAIDGADEPPYLDEAECDIDGPPYLDEALSDADEPPPSDAPEIDSGEATKPSAGGNRREKKGKRLSNGGARKVKTVFRFLLRMLRRLIIFALIIAVAAAVYYYYRIYKPGENGAGEYLLAEVTYKDLYSAVSASGKIAAKDEVSIYLKTPQRIDKILVKEGDRVYKGQLLVTYDIESELKNLEQKRQIAELNKYNAELSAQGIALPAAGNELLSYTSDVESAKKNIQDSDNSIESIKIRITQQQIRVDDAKKLMDKNNELYRQGFLTKDEYDLSVSSYKSAVESLNDLNLSLESEGQNLAYRNAQLKDAEKKLANAKTKLGDEASKLRYEQQLNIAELSRIEIEQIDDDIGNLVDRTLCPVSGNVVSVGAIEGAIASRGNPVVTLSDLSSLIVKADVSQYDAPQIKIGQKVDIYVAGLVDEPYTGVITKISASSVEKENGSEKEVIVPVEITVDNVDDRIKTGYNVDVDVICGERENALCIPSQAVFSEAGRQFVYVLSTAEDEAGASSDAKPGFGSYDLSALSELKSPGALIDNVKVLFGQTLETIDNLFPKHEAEVQILVKMPVGIGFVGDNGVEITDGLVQGGAVVLNP